jgi:hypothetical protein
VLCPALGDRRPFVRANAHAGLALAGARCNDGAAHRLALETDPSDAVRAAAAAVLAASSSVEDRRALERCVLSDRAGSVAARCSAPARVTRGVHHVVVYPLAPGQATPRPLAEYALALADATIHLGTSDRRGAAVEPLAPEGDVALLRSPGR